MLMEAFDSEQNSLGKSGIKIPTNVVDMRPKTTTTTSKCSKCNQFADGSFVYLLFILHVNFRDVNIIFLE